jgi:hypothetical protein
VGKHSREDLAYEQVVQEDRPRLDNDITVGKHSHEKLAQEEQNRLRQLQEAKALRLGGDRRISAAEREMLYHTLVGHRMRLLAQRAELILRLGDVLAEMERLDRQLDDIERSEFWRAGKDLKSSNH